MRRIYKYPIEHGVCTIELPFRARVVHVGHQNGDPMIWAEVDPENVALPDRRCFVHVGTGRDVQQGDEYVGSYQEGAFVWHVFERGFDSARKETA